MSNIYLFTWEEGYLLHKELTKRQERFENKNGPDTVLRLDLLSHDVSEITAHLYSGGLFSDSKLIILSGIPGTTTSPKGTSELEEYIINHRSQLNPDYFYIFVSTKPDKRKKAFKLFSEQCEVKTFNPMDMRNLPWFIQEEWKSNFPEWIIPPILDRTLIDYLVERVGKSWRILHHEINKLSIAIQTDEPLNTDTINTYTNPQQSSTAFALSDEMITWWGQLLHIIDTLSGSWEAWQAVQWWLLRSLKNIIAFGIISTSHGDIKTLWLPPFSVGKMNKYQDNIIKQLSSYIHIYRELLHYDYQVKTGSQDTGSARSILKTILYNHWFIK